MTRDLDSQNDVDVLLPIYYSQERFLIKSINSLISQTLRPKIICILNGMDFKYNKYYKELLNDLKVDKILLYSLITLYWHAYNIYYFNDKFEDVISDCLNAIDENMPLLSSPRYCRKVYYYLNKPAKI